MTNNAVFALPADPRGHPLPDLPRWDPIGAARARLDDAEALDTADKAALHQWCDDLQPRIDDLYARHPPDLIHGDAHVGNLLRTPDGDVVLCDFDATCWGPWQVDLVAVAVGEIRFRRPGAHHGLAAAYGYDVTADPDWPLRREARELKMIAAGVSPSAPAGSCLGGVRPTGCDIRLRGSSRYPVPFRCRRGVGR